MRGGHVQTALSVLLVASLCACEYNRTDVLDKWARQEKRATPEDWGDSAAQGRHAAADSLYSSPEPQDGSQSSSISVDGLKWSRNNSRSLFNGLLKVFGGLCRTNEIPRFLEKAQDDSSIRRRSAKEITTPHIIHQVFLDGQAALEEEERKEEKASKEFRRFNHRWRDSCQKYHPTWKHMFWDNAAAEQLLEEKYPWFLDTWRMYPRVVHRGDAIRPFLLDAYGGLYMDVDVECFDATDAMVDGFDLVLQLEDNGNKSLNNAVMAGAPGLEIWNNMQHLLKDRAPHLVAMHNKSRSQRDMSHAVLFATGPWLLRDAFKAFTGEAGELSGGYAGEHEVKGTRIMVYSLGQWFEPCEWSDLSCHALVDIAAVSGTPLRGIVGHHKNAGTWLKGYGEADPPTLAVRLRLGLDGNIWPTLALGATLITVVALVLCVRILRGQKRWRALGGSGLSRRMGSLSSFPSFSSGLELPRMERRSMSVGSRLHSLGGSQKSKVGKAVSNQKFSILNELEKGQL